MSNTPDPRTHDPVTAGIWLERMFLDCPPPSPLAPAEERERLTRRNAEIEGDFRRGAGAMLTRQVAEFHAAFLHPRTTDPSPRRSTWPGWYKALHMIPIAMGANEPRWMGGSWWEDHESYPLAHLQTADDVRRLNVPDWPSVPSFTRLLAARDQWRREHLDEPPPGFGIALDLVRPGRAPAPGISYAAFVDLGASLMGMTDFLTFLAGDQAAVDALADFCFRLSTGYADFLLSLQPERFEALWGFGGNNTCFLSPALYERYGAALDQRLFDHVRRVHGCPEDLSCNYHSCGPSQHLYDLWGRHPRRRNITTLQTRLLPGRVGQLRQNLPDVRLELTIHPAHFDVLRSDPDQLRALLLESARAAAGRDTHFTVLLTIRQPDEIPAAEVCLHVLHETMEQIRREQQSECETENKTRRTGAVQVDPQRIETANRV